MELQDVPTLANRGGDSTAAYINEESDFMGREAFSLPPVDRGKDAWCFLAASFIMEALIWGFPFAFGIFQDYYSTYAPFAGSSQIAVIGTCALGIMYLNLPFLICVQRLYPRQSRLFPMIGLLIMCISLSLSSFSQNVTHLIITQGVFYAIGGSISYSPCILYMDEWFAKRKGIAYGIMWSGTGLAGFVLPLLLELLLDRYGFRTALRVWALSLFTLTVPLAYFIKPRLPPTATAHIKPFKLGFALSHTFFLHQLANIIQALGFFLPGIYLPSYARQMGAGLFPAALTVLLINVATVFGCILMGSLTDRLQVTTCLMISGLGAAVGTFLFWGFATNMPLLYVFCVVYGLFGGSYSTTWSGIMQQVTARPDAGPESESNSIDPTMVLGLLSAGRGLGNIVSGPFSAALLQGKPWLGTAFGGYGSGYGPLILATGASALLSGMTFLWKKVGWM